MTMFNFPPWLPPHPRHRLIRNPASAVAPCHTSADVPRLFASGVICYHSPMTDTTLLHSRIQGIAGWEARPEIETLALPEAH